MITTASTKTWGFDRDLLAAPMTLADLGRLFDDLVHVRSSANCGGASLLISQPALEVVMKLDAPELKAEIRSLQLDIAYLHTIKRKDVTVTVIPAATLAMAA